MYVTKWWRIIKCSKSLDNKNSHHQPHESKSISVQACIMIL